MSWIPATYLGYSGDKIQTYINLDHVAAVTCSNKGKAHIRWGIASAPQLTLDEDYQNFIHRVMKAVTDG